MNQVPIDNAKAVKSSFGPKQQFPSEAALRKYGVDEAFIAKRLVNMFEAKRRRWDPATQSWKTFEDYKTQLEALKVAANLLGLFPSQAELETRYRSSEIEVRVTYEDPIGIHSGPQDSKNCKTN